jgi:hypothetical protein
MVGMLRAFRQRLHGAFETARTENHTEFHLRTRKPWPVNADGEIAATLPATFTVRPWDVRAFAAWRYQPGESSTGVRKHCEKPPTSIACSFISGRSARMLVRLCYVSRSLIAPHSPEMLDIVRASLRHNGAYNVTGALYFDERQFFQVIEGEATTIERLFERISRDRRHDAVALLARHPIEERTFGAWSMKFHDGTATVTRRTEFGYESLVSVGVIGMAQRVEALRAL